MGSSLDTLTGTAPGWATLLSESDHESQWLLAPPLPGGGNNPAIPVRIWIEDNYLLASESVPGARFPTVCPELHINYPDHDFCLGRYKFQADDPAQTREFWQGLGEFLHNQNFAARRKHWPFGRWLSHGSKATEAQLKAEAAAGEMGIGDEYAEWLEIGNGWLGGSLPPKNPKTGRVRLGSLPCPRQCEAKGRPIKLRDCKHRDAMVRLIEAELSRREGQREFYDYLRARGVTCCGRISNCGLAETREAA